MQQKFSTSPPPPSGTRNKHSPVVCAFIWQTNASNQGPCMRIQTPKAQGFLFALLLVGLGFGCGGKYFRPYIHDRAALTAVTRHTSGISLQVDPLLDQHACQTNFRMRSE